MIVFKRNLFYKHVGMQIVPLLAHLTVLDITIYSTFLFCAIIVPSLTQIKVNMSSDILFQICNRNNDEPDQTIHTNPIMWNFNEYL